MFLFITRKSWAERKAAGDRSLDVNRAAHEVDPVLEKQAQAVYDDFGKKGGGKGGKNNRKVCTACGTFGHVAEDCRKAKGGGKGKPGKGTKSQVVICFTLLACSPPLLWLRPSAHGRLSASTVANLAIIAESANSRPLKV